MVLDSSDSDDSGQQADNNRYSLGQKSYIKGIKLKVCGILFQNLIWLYDCIHKKRPS